MSVSEDSADHLYELSAGSLDWLKTNNNTTVQFMTRSNEVNYLVDHQKKILPPFFQEASCFHLSMEWTPLTAIKMAL